MNTPGPDAQDITRIVNLDRALAWDAAKKSHAYVNDAEIVITGGVISYIGPAASSPARHDTQARIVDGKGKFAMPGLVDVHSHPATEPMNRGLLDELGTPGLYYSSLYEYMPVFRSTVDSKPIAAQVAYGEMLLSGVTSVVDLSTPWDGWTDIAALSGLRVCLAPMFRGAAWGTPDGHSVTYEWNREGGEKSLAQALAMGEKACAHPSGRLSAMVTPAQIDTCPAALIRESFAEAEQRDWPWQIHAAQSIVEFHEITRREGKSPIGWLEQLGVLSDRSIIGHAIFLDDNPSTPWCTKRDLAILAQHDAAVAHCPTVFARRGIALRDFGRYRQAGVRVGIGTDTYPHTMLDDLRLAAYLGRIAQKSPEAVLTHDVFDAATVTGASMLRQDNIGHLAQGMSADIVLVDLMHPMMRPSIDPLRSLIFSADDRVVHSVFVQGKLVVENGRILTMDHERNVSHLAGLQKELVDTVAERDRLGRSIDVLVPPPYPTLKH